MVHLRAAVNTLPKFPRFMVTIIIIIIIIIKNNVSNHTNFWETILSQHPRGVSWVTL